MSNTPVSSEDQALQTAEDSLNAQINMGTNLAETAFRHIQHMPNASSLAAVTRALDLLKSFLPEAERLSDNHRHAPHMRLAMLLDDVTAARNTWAQTMGILASADLLDARRGISYQAGALARQKKLNEDLFKQKDKHAAEVKKIL
jgi:hypothetical protein